MLAVVLGGEPVLGGVFAVGLGGCPVAAGFGAVALGGRLAVPFLAQGPDQVLAVPGGVVAVLATHEPITGRQLSVAGIIGGAVCTGFGGGVALVCLPVALLCPPVALVAAAQQFLHVRRRLGCLNVPALGRPVAFVGLAVAPVGCTITAVRLPVAKTRLLVAGIGRLVSYLPAGCLPGALVGGLVASIRCAIAVEGGLVALLGFGVPPSHQASRWGRLPVVGDPVALVGDPVALIGDPVALIGDLRAPPCGIVLTVGVHRLGMAVAAWIVSHLASPCVGAPSTPSPLALPVVRPPLNRAATSWRGRQD